MCPLYREIRYDTTAAAIHIWRIFYFSPEREKGDRLELIIIKQPYMLIFFKLHRERSVSSNHTLERRHEREINAKKMSRKELKMAKKGKFVKEEIGHLFLNT
jgi:hypothetical protein